MGDIGISIIIKQDWEGKAKSKNIADALNDLAFQLNHASLPNGGTAVPTATGFQIEVESGFPWKLVSFGYSLRGEVVRIYPGTIRKHGIANYALEPDVDEDGADVTLTGTTEWVYAQMSRAGGTVTIEHSATEPESNATTLKVALYLFEIVPPSTSYSLSRICNLGDINFDTPIR
jgi:hypothetical protein